MNMKGKERRVFEPIVSIGMNKPEEQSLVDTLNRLPMDKIIKKGDKVVVTPNWLKTMSPSTATVVGPHTLRKLVTYIKGFEPASITIATGSGGDPTPIVMKSVGYEDIIKEEGINFIDLNFGPYVDLDLNHSIIKSTKINALLKDMDVLISFTQLKMHEEATMSACIKNIALGWPPADVHGFPKKKLGIHEDLHGFIKAMAENVPIDLSILSADKVMIGTGPSGGKAVGVEGLIIAGTDPIAVDTLGARLLGFLPQAVAYLYGLYRAGIGEGKPEDMTILGYGLKEAEEAFSSKAYNKEIAVDKTGFKDIHGTKPK